MAKNIMIVKDLNDSLAFFQYLLYQIDLTEETNNGGAIGLLAHLQTVINFLDEFMVNETSFKLKAIDAKVQSKISKETKFFSDRVRIAIDAINMSIKKLQEIDVLLSNYQSKSTKIIDRYLHDCFNCFHYLLYKNDLYQASQYPDALGLLAGLQATNLVLKGFMEELRIEIANFIDKNYISDLIYAITILIRVSIDCLIAVDTRIKKLQQTYKIVTCKY